MDARGSWLTDKRVWLFVAALVLAGFLGLFVGYGLGKDRAVSENTNEAAASTATAQEG